MHWSLVVTGHWSLFRAYQNIITADTNCEPTAQEVLIHLAKNVHQGHGKGPFIP
jgi:hypothetical protein